MFRTLQTALRTALPRARPLSRHVAGGFAASVGVGAALHGCFGPSPALAQDSIVAQVTSLQARVQALEARIGDMTVKPNVVFVLGGPGAGKGTQCEVCSLELGWVHISAGDLLRAERKSGSKQAELIESIIVAGKIVPSEITVGLLHKEMQRVVQEEGKRNFLIDGFPRNTENQAAWESVVGDDATIAFMLFFECPLAAMEKRILGRAKFSGRSDDNIESVRKRFNTYKKETMPIVELYRTKGLCVEVDTSGPKPAIYEVVKKALSEYTDASISPSKPLEHDRSKMVLGLMPCALRRASLSCCPGRHARALPLPLTGSCPVWSWNRRTGIAPFP